jgi:hypothetical protein
MSPGNCQMMKVERKSKIVIPHSVDLTEKLEVAREIIEFIYKNDVRTLRPKYLPEKFHNCGLNEASQSGILWYLGRKNRPKAIPEPFFIIYGASATFIPEGQLTICVAEGRMRIPAPPGLSPDTELRWIVVRKDTLTYYLKDTIDLEMGVSEDDNNDEKTNEENKPFNINQLPNLGIENTDD